MGILDYVNSTNGANIGIRAVISGVEKVGKTTLACGAPRVLLVPLEQGYASQRVQKTPMLERFVDVMTLLDEIMTKVQARQFVFKTIVFDTSTALERLIHTAVILADPKSRMGQQDTLTMESALGGYGKAYQYANDLFSQFLAKCDWLANNGVNIVLTCHVFAAKIIDPAHGEYDTWDLLLHSPKNQKSYGKREMLTQWADVLGFLYEPLYITKGEDKNSILHRGISANKGRVLALNRTPGWVAGNRFSVKSDVQIPEQQGWNYLADAIHKASGFDFFNRD